MTISNSTNRRVYTGPGDEFTYDFPVFDDDDIYVVIVQDEAPTQIVPDLNGADTYDFSVSGSFDSTALRYPNGVTVTLNNSLPDDTYTIAIECRPAQTQSTDYVNGGPLNAERLETDFDRLITIAQFFAGEVESSVRVSPTADVSIPPLIPQANSILVWDSDGEAIVNRSVFGRWRDVWATDTLYVELDIVRFEENGDAKDGNLYLCAVEHTSDVFDTDLAADRWQLIIDVAAVENAKDAAEAAQAAAETAESNAAASETAAAASESAAATSEANAATSESNAADSEDLAERWATEDEDVVVEGGKFSSYHWAQKTEDYAAMAVADGDVIFPNVSSVELADIPAGVQGLFVQGYTSAGDGGGALYKRVGSEPSHAGKIQSNDGAWWEFNRTDYVNVKCLGAKGNDSANDTTAILNAIAVVKSVGGGTVYHPAGVYLVSPPSGTVALSVDADNVRLTGDGPGLSVIKLADGGNAHVVEFNGTNDCGFDRLEVDGNRANNTTAGHGIRIADSRGLTIFCNHIHDCVSYGIGGQAGDIGRLKIHGNLIEDTGQDGIDIKNFDNSNDNIEIATNAIRRWGRNTSLSDQAGIDVGGTDVRCVHNTLSGFGDLSSATRGIVFRGGEEGDTHGEGANFSLAFGNTIECSSTDTGTVCIDVIHRANRILGNTCIRGEVGIRARQRENIIKENFVQASVTGIQTLTNASAASDGDYCTIVGNTSRGCSGDGVQINTVGCVVESNVSRVNDVNIRIGSTADETVVVGNYVGQATTEKVVNDGTQTVASNNIGWKTKNSVLSSTFAVDSTGTKGFSINHGLGVTPNLEDTQLTLVRDTNVNDYAIGRIRIDAVDATIVAVSVDVDDASATTGATARVSLYVDAL